MRPVDHDPHDRFRSIINMLYAIPPQSEACGTLTENHVEVNAEEYGFEVLKLKEPVFSFGVKNGKIVTTAIKYFSYKYPQFPR